MLTDRNLDIVELGHRKHRAHFNGTDETGGVQTAAALRHRLFPMICIGETLEDRKARHMRETQVRGTLDGAAGNANDPAGLRVGLGDRRERYFGHRTLCRCAAPI